MQPTTWIYDDFTNSLKEVSNLSGDQLDLLIYLSVRQNPWGNVRGLYYKDVCLDLGFVHKASFYNALHGLERKGYIKINYMVSDDWECTIIDNIFDKDEDDKKGYFSTNRAFLHTPDFRKLKVNEKKICIYLATAYQEQNFKEHGLKIYPETIAKKIGIKSTFLVYGYMENINKFFPNKREVSKSHKEIFVLSPGNFIPFDSKGKSERELFLTHKIKHFCRRFKICYTISDLKDLIILIGQYAQIGLGQLYGTICDVLLGYRSIEPPLINKLLSNHLSVLT